MAFDAGLPKTRQAEIAEYAAKLIRKGWARGYLATDMIGIMVDLRSTQAVNFCAVGAVIRSSSDTDLQREIANAFSHKVGMSVTKYNDCIAKSAEEVAKVFDKLAEDYNNGI